MQDLHACASASNAWCCSARVTVLPLAVSRFAGARAYETPLGRVPLDTSVSTCLDGLSTVRVVDAAHAEEHSLEVHVPFLQTTLSEFCLIPIVVGDATPAEVAAVLDRLWGDEETLIVVSSDLSHYLSYETRPGRRPEETRSAIEAQLETITPEQACGCRPINGLLHTLATGAYPSTPSTCATRATPRGHATGWSGMEPLPLHELL